MRKRTNSRKQGGFALSTELLVLLTGCLAMTVIICGSVGSKVVAEWGDFGAAIGSLDQSYSITGMQVAHPNDPVHPTPIATTRGSQFDDGQDFCDTAACDCGVRLCIPPNGREVHIAP